MQYSGIDKLQDSIINLKYKDYNQSKYQMSKLQLSHILGSSTVRPQQLGFAQDCLLYLSGSFIIFYNPIVDEQIAYLKHSSPLINCIAISSCEKLLAICSMPYSEKEKTLDNASKKINNITIYKLGEVGINEPVVGLTLRGHKHAIDHIAFSPDNKYLMTVSNKDGSMFVWDCSTGDRLTQNKNSKNVNSLKFMTEKDGKTMSMITTGRGNCKIWSFYTPQSGGKVNRINEEEHWILSGKTIPFNKKFATKQFIDCCFYQPYVLLLTSDGLLCMIAHGDQEDKLQKCIDLMIARTTSMDIYQNTVMCAGDNAIVKVIDLDTLTLVRKFPKPPPMHKENICKDYDEQDIEIYEQSEQFPQCVGIKTIGSNKFSQFIITLYNNLTLFVWRPQPQDIVAMRSIITHQASIKSIKILQQFKDELTFFSTISEDNTLRIWHVYKKCIYNRESIDIAQLIGIRRNAYCRNLTRIIYMESEKEVTCIAGYSKKSIACIAHKEFIMYSLSDFEVVCHQLLDCDAVALQIKDGVAYIGLANAKVVLYQILQQEDRLNKVREIAFQNKIKKMQVISDEKSKSFESILMIQTHDSNQIILYSLKKSKVVHVEKGVKCCSSAGHNIVMCKSDNTVWMYNTAKSKSMLLLTLKHEMQAQQYITNVSCNLLWIVITTSSNKLIVANFSPALICTHQFYESINDLAISDSGQIIMVGDYGDILIYRLHGTHGYEGMEQEVKKWMEKNDLSWMQGSVWAKKKSNIDDRQISGSVVDSIRLRASVGNSVRGSVKQLPNVQFKYKSNKNDQSVFNPNDILKQAKQIYNKIDGIEKKINNESININVQNKQQQQVNKTKNNQKLEQQDELEQIMITQNNNKNKAYTPQDQSNKVNSKKRIFGLSLTSQSKQNQTNKQKTVEKNQEGLPEKYRNNLVNSIVRPHIQQQEQENVSKLSISKRNLQLQSENKKQIENYSEFVEQLKKAKTPRNIRQQGQITKYFSNSPNKQTTANELELLTKLQQNLRRKQFLVKYSQQLKVIYQILKLEFQQKQEYINKNKVIAEFEQMSKNFIQFIAKTKQKQ